MPILESNTSLIESGPDNFSDETEEYFPSNFDVMIPLFM